MVLNVVLIEIPNLGDKDMANVSTLVQNFPARLEYLKYLILQSYENILVKRTLTLQ